MTGRVWIYDGFDESSHHRRLDLSDDFNRNVIGMTANSQRFAYDFVPVDAAGRAFTGSPGEPDNWVGWGQPVLAPERGVVVAIQNDIPDVLRFDAARLSEDPLLMLGNYVMLRHACQIDGIISSGVRRIIPHADSFV